MIYVDSITSNAACTDSDVAVVPKGAGATLAQIPDSTTTGGTKRGQYAVDFQRVRNAATQVASGNYAFLGATYRSTASNTYAVVMGSSSSTASGVGDGVYSSSSSVASGGSSGIVGGTTHNLSGLYAFVGGGNTNTISGSSSGVVGGAQITVSGNTAFAGGGQYHTVSGANSALVGGTYGSTRGIVGYTIFPASNDPIGAFTAGATQAGVLVLGTQTTSAATATLRSDGNAATTTNQIILPNNSAYYFRGSVIANVTGGGNTKAWSFEGAIKRGANAAATTLINSVTNTVAQDAGASTWTIGLAADTTNGGLQVTVAGQASTTIRWVCRVETTEVTY